eukprot:Gb_16184 [translate_table: standard]
MVAISDACMRATVGVLAIIVGCTSQLTCIGICFCAHVSLFALMVAVSDACMHVTVSGVVYRIYTSVLFHGSVLHVMFNMLALVPIGSGLERIMGSIRYLHVTLLLATSNAVLHLLIAYLTAHNPLHSYPYFMKECTIGFSGIIFAMIVMETSLNGNQSRSVFGLFNVPGKWYAWILLVLFQLLMPHVSLIGHLCGILSGFSYTYGLFNHFLLGSSSYSAIESSALLAFCLRRPGFIVSGGSGAAGTGLLPSFSSTNASGAGLGNVWRNLHSWMPWRENSPDERGRTALVISTSAAIGGMTVRTSSLITLLIIGYSDLCKKRPYHIPEPERMRVFAGILNYIFIVLVNHRLLSYIWLIILKLNSIKALNHLIFPSQSLQDHRFPGRGRALGSSQSQSAPGFHSDSDMQARLLERNNQPEANSEMIPISTRGTVTSHARPAQTDDLQQSGPIFTDQDHVQEHDESIQNLVSMGFERVLGNLIHVRTNYLSVCRVIFMYSGWRHLYIMVHVYETCSGSSFLLYFTPQSTGFGS